MAQKSNTEKQTTNIAVMQTDIGYIKKSIEGIEKQLVEMTNSYVKKDDLKDLITEISDHETRVRRLENWGAISIGGLVVIEFVLNYFK